MEPKWTPIPDELRDITPPTRDDAIEHMERKQGQLGARRDSTFEASPRGQECAAGRWSSDYCDGQRQAHDEAREQHINSSLIGLQADYDRKVQRKARIDANNAAALEAETQKLRVRYMAIPGADEASFQRDLPGLLEARRQQAALASQSEQQRMIEQMRPNISI